MWPFQGSDIIWRTKLMAIGTTWSFQMNFRCMGFWSKSVSQKKIIENRCMLVNSIDLSFWCPSLRKSLSDWMILWASHWSKIHQLDPDHFGPGEQEDARAGYRPRVTSRDKLKMFVKSESHIFWDFEPDSSRFILIHPDSSWFIQFLCCFFQLFLGLSL